MLKGLTSLMRCVGLLVSIYLVSALATFNVDFNDNCNWQEMETHISQRMIVPYGGTTTSVLCVANVTLKKCEGSCESKVLPSVLTHSGYSERCRCCRETDVVPQPVPCYIDHPDLPSRLQRTLTVKYITGCACHNCND